MEIKEGIAIRIAMLFNSLNPFQSINFDKQTKVRWEVYSRKRR